nr:MAG TPA: hypothetical protein [Caudoviricetes sp.]
MRAVNFYTYKDGSKTELCKACMTMHVNNYEPDTFLWILEKMDLPWVPEEWNIIRDKAYQKDPYKMNGMSVLGKYISKMKLKQWNKLGWADSKKIQEEREAAAKAAGKSEEEAAKRVEAMEEAYKNGEITEAQLMTYKEITSPPTPTQPAPAAAPSPLVHSPYPEGNHPFEVVDVPDLGQDLTEQDKVYLAVKWGRLYSAEDWIYLEQKYTDFMASFDIQGAARIDTLIQICKLSLKLNNALDSGDIDSYSKLSRAYDTLMKSAKFTEAQNKDNDTEEFDSVGAIVAFCEKEGGFIPEYKIDAPQDVIDTILADNKEYLQTLIHNDSNLSQQIEMFLKKKEILEEQKRDRLAARDNGSSIVEMTDKDLAARAMAIQDGIEQDDVLLGINNESEEEY